MYLCVSVCVVLYVYVYIIYIIWKATVESTEVIEQRITITYAEMAVELEVEEGSE